MKTKLLYLHFGFCFLTFCTGSLITLLLQSFIVIFYAGTLSLYADSYLGWSVIGLFAGLQITSIIGTSLLKKYDPNLLEVYTSRYGKGLGKIGALVLNILLLGWMLVLSSMHITIEKGLISYSTLHDFSERSISLSQIQKIAYCRSTDYKERNGKSVSEWRIILPNDVIRPRNILASHAAIESFIKDLSKVSKPTVVEEYCN